MARKTWKPHTVHGELDTDKRDDLPDIGRRQAQLDGQRSQFGAGGAALELGARELQSRFRLLERRADPVAFVAELGHA